MDNKDLFARRVVTQLTKELELKTPLSDVFANIKSPGDGSYSNQLNINVVIDGILASICNQTSRDVINAIKKIMQQSNKPIDPEKNCTTCVHKHCLFFNEQQNPVYKTCWLAPETTENSMNIELDGKMYGGIPTGQMVFVSAHTNKDQTRIPPVVTMTGQRGTTPVFIIDSMFEYEAVKSGRGFTRTHSVFDDFGYVYIEDLDEQEQLEKRLKANEKVLRKHPARKDLFLENRTLRERIKELKRKNK